MSRSERTFAFNPVLREALRVPVENLLTETQRRAFARLKSGPLYRTSSGFESGGEKFKQPTGRCLADMGLAVFDPDIKPNGALVLSVRAQESSR